MRTIETALWPLEKPAIDVGLGVFLDREDAPALAGLTEGERVLLVEPNELQAEAVVRMIEIGGRIFWFGEIGDESAIQIIHPNPALSSHRPAEA